jgi:hypothetical protein
MMFIESLPLALILWFTIVMLVAGLLQGAL